MQNRLSKTATVHEELRGRILDVSEGPIRVAIREPRCKECDGTFSTAFLLQQMRPPVTLTLGDGARHSSVAVLAGKQRPSSRGFERLLRWDHTTVVLVPV